MRFTVSASRNAESCSSVIIAIARCSGFSGETVSPFAGLVIFQAPCAEKETTAARTMAEQKMRACFIIVDMDATGGF